MSEILKNWIAGLGLPGLLVIDGHIHIGEWRHAATFANAEEAAAQSVASMDATGIDACCVQSGGYMFEGMDYRLGNDFLLAVCRRVPDRLIGFACVNPNDSRGNILDELARVYDAGIRAIKLINDYQENYPGDGPNLMAVYEFAARRGMIVFNHSWRQNVIEKISAAFPDTPFIFGHYGGGWPDAVLKERANVYANIWSRLAAGLARPRDRQRRRGEVHPGFGRVPQPVVGGNRAGGLRRGERRGQALDPRPDDGAPAGKSRGAAGPAAQET